MQIISTEQELDAFCGHAAEHNVLSCDTEFVRVRTYYPELALIQIATDSRVALIDPLGIKDFTNLQKLFEDKDIVKVFHAPRQDIELLRHALGMKPCNIFDTQIAAGFLGLPDQIGYEALVREVLEVQLDKSSQFTDWLQRPLSEAQLHYAAADVTYLLQIYKNLDFKLGERMAWAQNVSAQYDNESLYETDLTPVFLKWAIRLKKDDHRIRLWLALNWRENRAIKINRPRNWVMKDADMLAFARQEDPVSVPPGLQKDLREKYDAARDAVKTILADANKPLTGKQKNDLKLVKEKLHILATLHQMPPRFAASKQDVESYVRNHERPPSATAWQNALFWDKILEDQCDN